MKIIETKTGQKLQIITEAFYKAEGKQMVIYQCLEEPFEILAEEAERFYEMCEQEEMKREPEISEMTVQESKVEEIRTRKEMQKKSMHVVEEFLDAKTYQEKIELLESEENIDANVLELLAASMDVFLEGESLDEKYYSLMKNLRIRAKFETNR